MWLRPAAMRAAMMSETFCEAPRTLSSPVMADARKSMMFECGKHVALLCVCRYRFAGMAAVAVDGSLDRSSSADGDEDGQGEVDLAYRVGGHGASGGNRSDDGHRRWSRSTFTAVTLVVIVARGRAAGIVFCSAALPSVV